MKMNVLAEPTLSERLMMLSWRTARTLRSYVEIDGGYSTPCWYFLGATKNGYGMYHIRVGITRRAHRLFFEFYKQSKIPTDREIDHLCQTKRCVNPEHLELVTHTVNVRRGPHTNITIATAEAIRECVAAGERQVDVARRYSVSPQTVCYIIKRTQWR